MIAAESALGFLLTGRSPLAILRARDPVSGAAYYASLVVFALMPWWWARRAIAQHAQNERSGSEGPAAAVGGFRAAASRAP
jgi:hypothetical protein